MKSRITIKKIQELLIKGVKTIHVDDDTSRRMWWASLEVIQKDATDTLTASAGGSSIKVAKIGFTR